MNDKLRMEQLDLFGGEPTQIHTKQEWFEAFTKHCDEIYDKEGDSKGTYCCGYHWCCDKCKCELAKGCADCVATIVSILEENGVEIDYNDFDFDYWERKARELCQ